MNLLLAVLELEQMRSGQVYSFLLYSFSLKVSCEGEALIFCISTNTLKLGNKSKVDSSSSDREEAVRLLLLVWFHILYLGVDLKMFVLLVSSICPHAQIRQSVGSGQVQMPVLYC